MSVQQSSRRSREGAWIEMLAAALHTANAGVAPARERGLKWFTLAQLIRSYSRSREGAWIEISFRDCQLLQAEVAPARERGLK